jgi:predicted nucleotide-binding protein
MSRAEAAAKLESRVEKSRELQMLLLRDGSAAKSAIEPWHSYNERLIERMFTDSSVADDYRGSGYARVLNLGGTIIDEEERRNDALQDLTAKVARLREIREQLELYDEPADQPAAADAPASAARRAPERRAAFVVHGHDEAAREATARVLAQLGVEPIILHEQANRGQTIIEKFERHSKVPFAVVLLTPDDVGRAKDQADLKARARQNVWFELGFFVGKLGRDHVCALYKGPLEIPSDIQGVIYTPMDDAGAWRVSLANELHAAGIEIDLNKLRRP